MSPKAPGPDWGGIMDQSDRDTGAAASNHVEGSKEARKSWASVLGGNLPVRDNKNVLEVVLEAPSL